MFTEFAAALPAQLPLALAWFGYALIHSLTASGPCKRFAKRHWPDFFAGAAATRDRYRLLYNTLAALLLLPVVTLAYTTPGPALWSFRGVGAVLANGLAGLALLSFLRHGSGYDLPAFLGLRPANASPRLVISDWHRYVRHPWYCLALILIWTRDMDAAGLVSALAITLYLALGSRLEENRLVEQFGERYRHYRRRVPPLLPWPGRVLSRAEARRLAD